MGEKVSYENLSERQIFQRLINLQIPQWRVDQVTLTYSLIAFWQANLDKLFKTACKKYEVFRGSKIFDAMADIERVNVYEEYPALLWSNIFITSFSSCDILAKRICQWSDPSKISFEDYIKTNTNKREYGVTLLLGFMKKNDIANGIHRQDELRSLKYLRDVIIHNSGILSEVKYEVELRKYVSRNEFLKLGSENFIRFDYQFVYYAIDILHEFLLDIRSALYPNFTDTQTGE